MVKRPNFFSGHSQVTPVSLLACTLAWSMAAMAGPPEVVAPPGSRVQWVGKEMVQNGVPMSVRRFDTSMSPKQVLQYYRERWTTGPRRPPVENRVGGWRVIGRQVGGYYVTVQVRPGAGGSEGFIGVSMLPQLKAEPELDREFPRLAGTEVVSDTRSEDEGKSGQTLILRNDYSVITNAQYYREQLPARGWALRQDYSPAGGAEHVQYFERSRESLHIVIAEDPAGGTGVVVNKVKHHAE